jgi:hypothetical protein
MKTAALFAPLVAAATVSAAELKDPAEVGREWSKTLEDTAVAQIDATSLRAMSPDPYVLPERIFQTVPAWEPRKEPSPFDGMIRPPDYKPGEMPKGAKPYEFNGETYWIIPITSGAET